ncbi:MAG: hypothetical protein HC901_03880, partial [Bdellovibrionaceae bacterium]|nr:hypothetical protein [Pseudobdellovibrionaceae bacterium]
KYLIEQRGLDWFRNEVQSRLNFPLQAPKEVKFTTVSDVYGWTAQGDGRWFRTIYVAQGRIQDTGSIRQRSAFREIAQTLKPGIRLTPNCNVLFHDVAEADKVRIDAILENTACLPTPA